MEEPRFDPLDYLSAFNRRKWWFIVPVGLSIVIGLLLIWLLPRSYQSTATIGISTPRVAANMVGAASRRSRRAHARHRAAAAQQAGPRARGAPRGARPAGID